MRDTVDETAANAVMPTRPDAGTWSALSDAAGIDAYGYAVDDISRADARKFDADDVARALAKLELMVSTGAISQADFEDEKRRFESRLAEREQRQERIREREAKKAFALKAKAKAERAARNKADAMRAAAQEEEEHRAEYQRRQRAAVAAVEALVEPLHRAQALLEQPRRSATSEARSILRRTIPAAREAGRRDIELSSLRSLAQAEDRLGNQVVADGIRAEAVSLQRRMPSLYANRNRDGLEVRDGVPMQQLRALDRFLGHGVPESAQSKLPSGSTLALAQNIPLPSSPPPRKITAERRREQRRLRSIYGEGATAMSPDLDRRKTRAHVRSRSSPRAKSSLVFGSQSLNVLAVPWVAEADNGREASQTTLSSAIHNAEAISIGAAPLTPTIAATETPGTALALVATADAENAADGDAARHAAYGGEFTSSAWLKAQRSAKTREPLCPFDPGPGGLCRNCHQKQRHDWHRPRTPPQAQMTNGDGPAAAVTVIGPGVEATAMPELAAAMVLAPRGQEPVDEAVLMHEQYRKAKEARKAKIEKLPIAEHEYSILLEPTEADFRSLQHGAARGSPGGKKRHAGRSLRKSGTNVATRTTGPEAELAALLESRWDREWTLLERSVGSKKEGARQRDLAAERAQEQAIIQQVRWLEAKPSNRECVHVGIMPIHSNAEHIY